MELMMSHLHAGRGQPTHAPAAQSRQTHPAWRHPRRRSARIGEAFDHTLPRGSDIKSHAAPGHIVYKT
jgi:hypothetical protein